MERIEENQIKISIVSVVYNADEVFEKTILSVIGQTYSHIEYIVIDGESTDHTKDIIQKYRNYIDVLVMEKDQGIYDAMNKALPLATGDFLIFMNAGDLLLSNDIIDWVVSYITKKDNVYYGDAIFVNDERKQMTLYAEEFTKYTICNKNLCYQTIFYPRIAYQTMRFDLRYPVMADYKYNITLMKEYSFVHLPLIVCLYNTCGISSYKIDSFFSEKLSIIFQQLGFLYGIFAICTMQFWEWKLFIKKLARIR